MSVEFSHALKEAMKAKNSVRVRVIRAVQAQIKELEIEKQRPAEDQEALQIIQKQLKQRHDAAQIYEQNARPELAEKERLEAEELSSFLPKQLSDQELTDLVSERIEAVGASSMADMGKVMGAVKPKLEGKAEPQRVAALIKKLLSN